MSDRQASKRLKIPVGVAPRLAILFHERERITAAFIEWIVDRPRSGPTVIRTDARASATDGPR